MQEAIVRAKPNHLAAIGAIPFVAGAAAVILQALTGRGLMIFYPALWLGIAMILLWIWSVSHAVNERIPVEVRPQLTVFRIAMLFVAAYTTIFTIVASSGDPVFLRWPSAFLALHVTAGIAMLKALHFVGENVSQAERAVGKAETSAWTTALTLFSIGGIVPVQRRINEIFARPDPILR